MVSMSQKDSHYITEKQPTGHSEILGGRQSAINTYRRQRFFAVGHGTMISMLWQDGQYAMAKWTVCHGTQSRRLVINIGGTNILVSYIGRQNLGKIYFQTTL